MSPREDEELDEALADTFPASDPPSQTVPVTATAQRPPPESQCLYRVIPRDEAAAAFDRQPHYGARRWSSEGTAVVYASMSVGGALLEALAHMDGPVPDDLVLAIASLPLECITPAQDLPAQWRAFPYRPEVQRYGDASIERVLALKVPSAICEREYNILLNPEHPDRDRVHGTEIVPMKVDPRVRA